MEPAWNKWEDYSSGSGIQMKNQGLVDNQVLLQYILEKINGLGKIGCGRHISRMSIRKMGYFTLVQSTVELWTSEVTGHNNRSELFVLRQRVRANKRLVSELLPSAIQDIWDTFINYFGRRCGFQHIWATEHGNSRRIEDLGEGNKHSSIQQLVSNWISKK